MEVVHPRNAWTLRLVSGVTYLPFTRDALGASLRVCWCTGGRSTWCTDKSHNCPSYSVRSIPYAEPVPKLSSGNVTQPTELF